MTFKPSGIFLRTERCASLLTLILLLVTLVYSASSFAQAAPESEIEMKTVGRVIPYVPRRNDLDRPSMHAVLELRSRRFGAKEVGTDDPIAALNNSLQRDQSRPTTFDPQQITILVSQYIAQMETAFPGLTYVFLGRDTSLIASAVEAFYLSIGESGRVVQLGIGAEALKEMTAAEITTLLATNGFRVLNKEGLEHPYIFMDRTTNFENGQLATLRHHAYAELLASGLPWSKVKTQVAAVNLIAGSGTLATGQQIRNFVEKQALRIDGGKPQTEMMNVGLDSLLNSAVWHDSFHGIRHDEAGRVGAQPGPSNTAAQGRITDDLIHISELFSSQFVLDLVKRKAKDLGSNFKTPNLKDPDVRTVSEAVRVAANGDEKSRLKVLRFLRDASLTVEDYQLVFGAIHLKNPKYEVHLNALKSSELTPAIIAVAELLITYDTLLNMRPFRMPKLRRVASELENRALQNVERLIRLSFINGDLRIREDVYSNLGLILHDPQDEHAEAITKRLLSRWQKESPHLDEKLVAESKKFAIQKTLVSISAESVVSKTIVSAVVGGLGWAVGHNLGYVEAFGVLLTPHTIAVGASILSGSAKPVLNLIGLGKALKQNTVREQVSPGEERLINPAVRSALSSMSCARSLGK